MTRFNYYSLMEDVPGIPQIDYRILRKQKQRYNQLNKYGGNDITKSRFLSSYPKCKTNYYVTPDSWTFEDYVNPRIILFNKKYSLHSPFSCF